MEQSEEPKGAPAAMLLRAYRRASGLTQEALARRIGVHHNYVSLVERGVHSPTLRVVEAWLAACSVTWREFGADLEARNERSPGQDASDAESL